MIVFISGCLSEELYATGSELLSDNVQVTGCNELEPEESVTDAVAINNDIKDHDTYHSTGETCSCSSENSTELLEEDTETHSNSSSGMKSEIVQDLISDSLSQRDQKANKTYEHQGARPKVTDKSKNTQGSSNAHLSNKKRKELAKQEKKKRREERKKDDSSPCLDSSVAELEQSTSAGMVADLGLLAI